MKSHLKTKTNYLPQKPGIYFLKNKKNEIIYIGKARSLRHRVKSYFQPTSDRKIKNILSEASDVDYILTESEKEASFLENNFIQQHQPKFNLKLKDDKTFPYLKLTTQEKFPGIYFTRSVESDGARYFGPFSKAHQARKTIHIITKYFGIRTCQEAVPGKRKRPCLEYDMKLCSAPCVAYISEAAYRESTENALLFLEGKTEKLLKIINQKMKDAAVCQGYEQAAHWRDLIFAIEQIKEKPKFISIKKENQDIYGFSRQKEKVAIYTFLMREGKVRESKGIYIQERAGLSNEAILHTHLKRFYEKRKDVPDRILLPFMTDQKELFLKKFSPQKGEKVKIIVPLKGKNKKLVELANTNAEILLRAKSETLSPLAEIKEILGLRSTPNRIEGFDISNIGGEDSVGSLVIFEDGRPLKRDYRKFKIKTVRGPDDVASLKEIIRRRYSSVLEKKEKLPDLILVDGGKGQLNASRGVLKNLGLSRVPLVSLAKKEEILFTATQKDGISLERTSPALKLFQRIRDEAHRFAISFHRQRREKRSFVSLLDGIRGIGQKRKTALLANYKGIKEIKNAPLKELTKIVGARAAKALHDKLK